MKCTCRNCENEATLVRVNIQDDGMTIMVQPKCEQHMPSLEDSSFAPFYNWKTISYQEYQLSLIKARL